MSWPQAIIDLSSGSINTLHWNALAIVNAFVAAHNERSLALNLLTEPLASYTTEHHAQSLQVWRWQFQQWINANYVGFAPRKRKVGAAWELWPAPAYYTGEAALPSWAVLGWAAFCESAGCSASGFRRVPAGNSWPADWRNLGDPAYAFGMIQAGDLIGPWIIDDLYRMFNEMVWTVRTHDWEITSEEECAVIGEGVDAAWSQAVAGAEDMYPWPWPAAVQSPQASTLGWKDDQPPYSYVADIGRNRAMAAIDGVWTARKKEADWYVLPAAPGVTGGVFDAYADPPDSPSETTFGELLWHLWRTELPPTTDDADFRSGAQLGEYGGRPAPGRDAGAWCAEPGALAPTQRGWRGDDWRVVLRWDVTGGLAYVAP